MTKAFLFIMAITLFLPFNFSIAETQNDTSTKIGVIMPLTGPFERYGIRIQEAIRSGNSCGAKLIYENEACDPNQTATAYKKLTQVDGINLFLGPFCGSPQLIVAEQIKNKSEFALLASSAPSSVFQKSNQKMFSTMPTIESEATFMAEYLNKQKVASVATIYFDNFFSSTHEQAFLKKFQGKVLETFAYTSNDLAQIKSIALKVKQLKPDTLYVPDAFPLMAGLSTQLAAINADDIKIYSVYSALSEDVLKAVSGSRVKLFFTYPKIQTNALDYYPKLAMELLCKAVTKCQKDLDCLKKDLSTNNAFDENGALSAEFELRTIESDKFVTFQE